MRVRRLGATVYFAGLALACSIVSPALYAHPMGNLSVNHYARLEPGAKGVDVTYVLDLAEIPTFELMQSWNVPRDSTKNVLQARAVEQARTWISNLVFTEGGKLLTPVIGGTELAVIEGAGSLPVFRITTKLHVAASGGRLEYEDRNYPTRAGWREVVIRPQAGADVARASNGAVDLSQALTSYPQDPTRAPPQDTKAWFEWKAVNGPVTQTRKPVVEAPLAAKATPPAPAALANPIAEPSRDVRPPEAQSMGTVKRNDAISKILRLKTISWPLMVTLIGLAFWFGALHALEPGHGKTMVAAYLVGARGTPAHAALLGGMVTFTHTISVFILGLATMFLSRYIMPDKISRVLGIISGLSIVWIGAILLWRRARNLKGGHSHEHHHHPHDHGHTHAADARHPHGHDHSNTHPHTHGHDHADVHSHSHAGHTHVHVGHNHAHDEHTHMHAGHDHAHDVVAHTADGHAHGHDGHDHADGALTHTHDGHTHTHAGHDHSHDAGHDHAHGVGAHTHDGHSHDGHDHMHGALTHTHDGHTHPHVPEGEISVGSLIALGASGGLVPCPSALILLLSAISIGRVGLGMILLLAFSLGLAIVLTATGLLVLYAKNLFPERTGTSSAFFRYMPVVSAAAILLIGVVMTSVSLGWIPAGRFLG